MWERKSSRPYGFPLLAGVGDGRGTSVTVPLAALEGAIRLAQGGPFIHNA